MSRTRAATVAPLVVFVITVATALLAVPAPAATTTKVNVILSEYIVRPKPKTAPPGKVEFDVENVGVETHEFVVVRANSPSALPTDADGAVDEEQIPEADQIGEIEDIESRKSAKATFKLKAGRYVLFCNIVEEDAATGEVVSHFAKGMYKRFVVKKS